MEGLQIFLVVAATLVIVSLLAVVPLVAGRRRRQDADRAGQVVLDREPGVGDDAGQPPRPSRDVARGSSNAPAARPPYRVAPKTPTSPWPKPNDL